jgi:hypothetical protein
MPSLLKTYSLNSGFKIRKCKPLEFFYPTPKKYITIQTSSGMSSKNYDYWIDVLKYIKKDLHDAGYEILHIGTEGLNIPFVKSLIGKTSLHQTNYILRNSSLHLGNDSFAVHLSGLHETPVVSVYGPTTPENHGPYFKSENTHLISSHRNGNNPSFASNEPDKTINMIKVEDIVNKVYEALRIKKSSDEETIFTGKFYPQQIIEIVPNLDVDANILNNVEPTIRCDYECNDNVLFSLLKKVKCSIITSKESEIRLYKICRDNVSNINFKVSLDANKDYVKSLLNIGIDCKLWSDDVENIDKIRFMFLDIGQVHLKKIDSVSIDGLNSDCFYISNKFILSNGKVFTSKQSMIADESIESLEDNCVKFKEMDEDFMEEVQFFRIIKKNLTK